MALLKALNREHGLTLMIVTHEFDIAAETDRIISMLDGHVVGDSHRENWAPGSNPWPSEIRSGHRQGQPTTAGPETV